MLPGLVSVLLAELLPCGVTDAARSPHNDDHQRGTHAVRLYHTDPGHALTRPSKILGGIADTTAQTITAVRERAVRKPGGVTRDDVVALEIHELDRKVDWPPGGLIPDSEMLPPPFDFERLVRFMAYPFIMTPVQHRWFKFLSTSFPMKGTGAAMGPALKRMAFDQLLFAPVGQYMRRFPLDCERPVEAKAYIRRTGRFLHVHECRRGRRQAGRREEVPRRLPARAQGELGSLACCATAELSRYAHTVPNCGSTPRLCFENIRTD